MSKKEKIAAYGNLKAAEKILSERGEQGFGNLDIAEASQKLIEAENLKSVKVTCHSPTMSVDIGHITKGLSDEAADSLKKYSKRVRLSVFPEIEKKLNAIQSGVRMKLKKCTLSGSDLMEVETFKDEFLPFLKNKNEELEALKGELRGTYEKSIEEFNAALEKLTTEVCNTDNEKHQIMASVKHITGRKYDSFIKDMSIALNTDFGPEVSEEELKKFLENSKRNSAFKNTLAVIKGLIDTLWDRTLVFLKWIENEGDELDGKVALRARESLSKTVKEVTRSNVMDITFIKSVTDILKTAAENPIKQICEDSCLTALATLRLQAENLGMLLEVDENAPTWLDETIISTAVEELEEH